MNRTIRAAFVVGRRDFTATVFSRTFLLFLLAPVVLFGVSLWIGKTAGERDAEANRPTVVIAAEPAAAEALVAARAMLAGRLGERAIPQFRTMAPDPDLPALAERLLGDEEANHVAVVGGTLDEPVLAGPPGLELEHGPEIALVLDQARQARALAAAGAAPPPVAMEQVVIDDAAAGLRSVREALARMAQLLVFFVTLMLSTVLLSNLVEEKSNKVIEILAAAVPLDSVFLGKLVAMLAISLVGIALWGALLALAWTLVPMVQQIVPLPTIVPGLGWPLFALLLLAYYTANYMLLGALFLGIGGQASSFREVQTLSMPATFLQLLVLLLAINAIGSDGGWLAWIAYVFPLSSPLAMIPLAAESELLWPHLAALAWQALWIYVIIRLSAAVFRRSVLKSGGPARRGRIRLTGAWRKRVA